MLIYKIHPLCTIFPALGAEALAELAADVEENGLREPITLLDGAILDGRNRASACHAAGVEPRFEEWQPRHPGDTPQAFVISRNLLRRHMKESERAMVAARLVNNPWAKKSAKTTAGQAADMMNVSATHVQRGRRVLKLGISELLAKVDSGEITVRRASEIAAMPPDEQRAVLAVPVETKAGGVRPPRQRDEAKADSFVDEINAWIDATAERRHDIRELSPDQRVAVAKRFMCLMCALKPCRSIIGAPTGECETQRPKEAPKPKPRRVVYNEPHSRGGRSRFGSSQFADYETPIPSGKPKPGPVDDEVAAFLANGGKIERCPPTVNPTPEDTAALAAHHAQREEARRAKVSIDPRA